MTKVFLGADHQGFQLKEKIKNYLSKSGLKPEDLGNSIKDPNDDYPDFALRVAKKVNKNSENRGILICGSGGGMAIASNKVRGIRAGTAVNPNGAKLLREHNDVNVLCLGANIIRVKDAERIVSVFLSTEFSKEIRHKRRIAKITKIQNEEKFNRF